MRYLNLSTEIIGDRSIFLNRILFHLALCLIIYFSPTYAIFMPIIPILAIKFHREGKYEYVLLAGVYALCCKSESVFYPYALTIMMLLLFNKSKLAGNQLTATITTRFLQFFGFLTLTYFLQLFNDGSVFSFPFFILTFFSPIAILFYVLKTDIAAKNIRAFLTELISFATAQILIMFFLQALPRGVALILEKPTMGDYLTGTTNASNLFGFLLCIAILPFLVNYIFNFTKFNKSTIALLAMIVMFIFMVHLSDAKSRLYAFVLAAGIVVGLKKLIVSKRLDLSLLYSLLVLCSFFFFYNLVIDYLDSLYIRYIEYITGKSNAKLEYYKRVFSWNTRSLVEYILGTGPGTNGSRSANTLASDVLYKSELYSVKLPSFIPPKSNEFTREHLAKLYTPEYAMTTSERSAILGNPFNSICSIFVEFGVLGTILFIRFVFPLYITSIRKNNFLSISACMLLFVAIILGIIDQSFETAMIMFFMYLFFGLSTVAGRLAKQQQKMEISLAHNDQE